MDTNTPVNGLLLDQFTHHWSSQARPRLQGLSDAEYLWEPVPGCWSLRTGDNGPPPPSATVQVGAGEVSIDFAMPEPTPPPFTTITWRLGHLIVGVLGERNAAHFGGPEISYQTHRYAGTAEAPMAELVLHIHRELIHHLAEVATLRDLYLHRASG